MSDLRILQIANRYLDVGGEETSVERIAGHVGDTAVLNRCLFESREWTGPNSPSVFNQARWMLKNPAALERIRALDAASDPDLWLVHNVFPIASAGVYSLAERLNRPIVQYLHNFRPLSINGYNWAGGKILSGGIIHPYVKEVMAGAWQDSRLKTAWFGVVLSWLRASGALRSVKAWIAISEFVRQKFIEAGFPADRIFTIPHSWNPENRSLRPVEEGDCYLFLGRLIQEKGVQVLFQAWESLRARFGVGTPKLLIAGSGPLSKWVRDRCSVSEDISYVGQVAGEEKDRLLQRARALIVPSLWWEPLGLVAYEAYDYGRPVFAARSGGLAETVVHGQTGFLHEPGDFQELANHIARAEENPSFRRLMGDAGRDWLLENTGVESWKKKFAQVVDLVREEQGIVR